MTNLYKDYILTRESLDVFENENGFILFRLEDDHCYISDYYVKPEYRRKGLGYEMADQVLNLCLDKKVPYVFCQSDKSAKGHEIAEKSIKNYGFKAYMQDGDITHYVLGVEEWEKR